MTDYSSLSLLGWNDFMERQLTTPGPALTSIVRVCSVHSMVMFVMGATDATESPSATAESHDGTPHSCSGTARTNIPLPEAAAGIENISPGIHKRQLAIPGNWLAGDAQARPTVGDWLVLDPSGQWPERLLERRTLVIRRAPSDITGVQLVAANLDTLFIVSSLNEDFNLSRLERYLAIAFESQVQPVVVLTKADLVTPEYAQQCAGEVTALCDDLPVLVVNALDAAAIPLLLPWAGPGQTATLVGSSGVGKSTLVNTLSGEERTLTGSIRDADGKGRHTTSSRTLYTLPGGGLIMDVPGFRELRLPPCEPGLRKVFADVDALASRCGFSDCQHDGEPQCAVEEAVTSGHLTRRRVDNYRKLFREQAALDDEKQQAKVYARQRRAAQRTSGRPSSGKGPKRRKGH